MAKTLKDRLIKILFEKGLLDEAKLEKAKKEQKTKGGKLSDILVKLNLVKQEDLMVVLSQQLKIPLMKLSKFNVTPEITKIIPRKIAAHYQIIPISKIADTLTVAMADPLNIFTLDDIKALTGFKINPVITTSEEIQEALNTYYGGSDKIVFDGLLKEIEEHKEEGLATTGAKKKVTVEDIIKTIQSAPIVKITDMLLAESIKRRSSDILIEPQGEKLRVRYRVDGILQEGQALPMFMSAGIVSRIKVMAELDIAEQRLPQDGRFKAKIDNNEIDFRVSVIPSSFGEKVAIRILDKSQALLDITKLGFELKPLTVLNTAAKQPHGMILICGPTGSGKTTTLYSILKCVDTPTKNLITVEDPIEYQLEGVNQVTARPEIGLTFANALKSILRQDPDIVMVGEIRDFETVDIAIKAALTGHLVLSTLHTTTASGAIVRLMNMGVEPFLITSSVLLVGAQRLIRKICPNCKESYEISADSIEFKGLNLETEGKNKLTVYRGKGCRECMNTGYRGRVGLLEVFPLTAPIKELILGQVQEHEIRSVARKEGMTTLRENGLTKVKAGVTTLEEVLRVTVGETKQ